MSRPPVLIVGSWEDPHARSVATRLSERDRVHPVVVDASTLRASRFVVEPSRVMVVLPGEEPIELEHGARAWLRRVAPDGWDAGTVLGSHDAAVKSSWLSLLSGIARTAQVAWLTDPAAAAVAENKLVQYAAAKPLDVRTPRTIVSSDLAAVTQALGQTFVVKPLGPAEFREDDHARAMFTVVVSADDMRPDLWARAPFIAQELVRASRHLRVVTVGSRAWIAALESSDELPMDWRRATGAHRAFWPHEHDHVADQALRMAASLRVGYSSQDWVVDSEDVPYFLDLNPGGQWMFLPFADAVCDALASWLEGEG